MSEHEDRERNEPPDLSYTVCCWDDSIDKHVRRVVAGALRKGRTVIVRIEPLPKSPRINSFGRE